jgi:FkbM family methyltransferase
MKRWSHADFATRAFISANGWRGRLHVAAYLIGRYLTKRYKTRTRQTPKPVSFGNPPIWINVSSSIGGLGPYYEIVHQGIYSPLPDFVPQPGYCVVDVGANIGIYSAWALRHMGDHGSVVSIEPHPRTFSLLMENLRLNGRTSGNAFQVGCGKEDGILSLTFDPREPTMASFRPRSTGSQVDTEVKRLDGLIQQVNPHHIDILKIDVEGWELEVIKGAHGILPRVQRILIEVESESHAARVADYLVGEGFRLVHRLVGIWNEPQLQVLSFVRNG